MQGLDDELCEKLQDEIHNSNGNNSGLGEDMDGYDEEMTHISSEIFILKRGIKLPKSAQEWSTANEYFKAAFSNQPIIASDIDSNIKTMSNIIYAYFVDRHGYVDSFPDRSNSILQKYCNASIKDLKKRLKQLKLNKGDVDEIRLVSRYLRIKLNKKTDNTTFSSEAIDHDKYFDRNYWKYVKKVLNKTTAILPSFNKEVCFAFFSRSFSALRPNKCFAIPSWIPKFANPNVPFNLTPPTYHQITNIIRKMKASGSPCPLDQISIICFKRCPYLRSYLTDVIRNVWISGIVPTEWKKAATILIHKKGDSIDPSNFRPITLESVPLKVFTSCLRNSLYAFLYENGYVEQRIQKGFTPKISGTLEHTAQMANIINKARTKQRSLVITLLDLKNAFGEVHHNLIQEVLSYYHIPEQVKTIIKSLYSGFQTSILTAEYNTPFITVGRGVLQGDCLSPLLFNMCFNTFIQHIKEDHYNQCGFHIKNNYASSLRPVHWFQFADDAAVVTGQESENQILLNRFSIWCNWADMIIRVDKCITFGIRKSQTKSIQFQPQLLINSALVPQVKANESFRYLGRYYDFGMSNEVHKKELISTVPETISQIDRLPLHPKNKLRLYNRYLLAKISWHLTVADISATWIKENLDSIVSKYIRIWLDLPVCATLSNIFLSSNKFGLNICPPSVKFTECQAILRIALRSSPNADITNLWRDTSVGSNLQYDTYRNTKDVLKSFRCNQEEKLRNHLISQGSFFSTVTSQALLKLNSLWSSAQGTLPKNIFNFTVKYINNTLPTKKNLCRWGLSSTSDCSLCLRPESLLHVVAGCTTYLNNGRFTWRHDSMLQFIAKRLKSIPDSVLYVDLPGYITPSVISGNSLRPDLLLTVSSKCLYILELIVGFEANLLNNAIRKTKKYEDLVKRQNHQYDSVKFISLSISTLGVFSLHSTDFLNMLKETGFDDKHVNYIIKTLTIIAIRTTYYVFCKRGKDWDNPELLFT